MNNKDMELAINSVCKMGKTITAQATCIDELRDLWNEEIAKNVELNRITAGLNSTIDVLVANKQCLIARIEELEDSRHAILGKGARRIVELEEETQDYAETLARRDMTVANLSETEDNLHKVCSDYDLEIGELREELEMRTNQAKDITGIPPLGWHLEQQAADEQDVRVNRAVIAALHHLNKTHELIPPLRFDESHAAINCAISYLEFIKEETDNGQGVHIQDGEDTDDLFTPPNSHIVADPRSVELQGDWVDQLLNGHYNPDVSGE